VISSGKVEVSVAVVVSNLNTDIRQTYWMFDHFQSRRTGINFSFGKQKAEFFNMKASVRGRLAFAGEFKFRI